MSDTTTQKSPPPTSTSTAANDTPTPTPTPPTLPNNKPPLPPTLPVIVPSKRLRLNPIRDHKSDKYDDLELDYSPGLFSNLEKYLPQTMLSKNRDDKFKFMEEVVSKYLPPDERIAADRINDYREGISLNYQPLHKEIYTLHPTLFFAPSFLKAINGKSVESFRRVLSEPHPGVFTFEMLNPRFCNLLIAEVENFEKWAAELNIPILHPNKMSRFGAVLDDFGFEKMLAKLMNDYICPISKVFYPEVGGDTLDSYHGFVVEYGDDKDTELGFHVDDSEVTLDVCLGKRFSGGDLHFRGTRCEKHMHSKSHSEELFDYAHVPGQAVLYRGSNRHCVRATASGHRINLVLWCKSSAFREMKKYRKDFPLWCAECLSDQKERQRSSLAAMRLELLGEEDDQ